VKTRPFARQVPTPALGDALEFLRQLWELDHALSRRSKRMEASTGITGPQRLVLRFIGRFPQISNGDLSALLHLHPSTLTGILDRLEQRGLVRRRQDPRDARRSLHGLTERGRELDANDAETIEGAIRSVFEGLDKGDVVAARRVLDALVRAISTDSSNGELRERGSAPRRRSAGATGS
jgi:DNA-binding MarR family transcriptional regulator